MTQIVTVNVTQQQAPTPSTLQGSGALISQGGTKAPTNSLSLLTQLSDLTPLVTAMTNIISISYTSGIATVTIPAGTLPAVSAEPIEVMISGAAPYGYNGTFNATVIGPTSFSYPLVLNPGAVITPGVMVVESAPDVVSMATTFFAQGATTSVYVLELGVGNPAAGVAALQAWIIANPKMIYSYLLPREWDGEPTLIPFMAQYEAPTAKTYFFVTTTLATYTSYTNLLKCGYLMVEAPGIPASEFSLAADFYDTLSYNPSATQQVTPKAFSYLYAVTPYPTRGNGVTLALLQAAFVNVVGTGAEGGISTAISCYGTTLDGYDFTHWYSVDWVEINVDLDLANEVINGSNNPLAPLYYNQPGVNRLQARAQKTMNRAITFGMALAPVTVFATPFAQYVNNAPGDFKIGKYNGLTVTYTPQRGFLQLVFNVQVSGFSLQ